MIITGIRELVELRKWAFDVSAGYSHAGLASNLEPASLQARIKCARLVVDFLLEMPPVPDCAAPAATP